MKNIEKNKEIDGAEKPSSFKMTIKDFNGLSAIGKEAVSSLCCEQCRHHYGCSVPLCPLDPLVEIRTKLSGEGKCPVSKSKRQKLAIGLPLQFKGMTKKEFTGHIKWQELSEEKKKQILGQLVKK